MAIYSIDLKKVPNQTVSTTISTDTYDIELNTRLDQLYMSITKNGVVVVYNRICQNKNVIAKNFMFVDLNASSDPTYDQLTTRYILLWSDEFN